jgi:hypothetical protein
VGRSRGKKWLLFIVVVIVIGWPAIKLMGMVEQRHDPYEATRLLYQVSLFQFELLNSHVRSASLSTDSNQLELLKQSAYSVQYTHQRLSMALNDELEELSGLDEMLEYIMRLQIGGLRLLDDKEAQVFDAAVPVLQRAYEAYKGVLSTKASVIPSKHAELIKADKDLFKIFHGKLLE